jgi:hypothetical protein
MQFIQDLMDVENPAVACIYEASFFEEDLHAFADLDVCLDILDCQGQQPPTKTLPNKRTIYEHF